MDLVLRLRYGECFCRGPCRFPFLSRTIIFFFLLGLWPAVLQAEILLGTSWSSPRELEQVAATGLRVRYITPRALFASGDEHALQQLKSRSFTPFLIDRSGPQEAYFLTDHLDLPLLPGVELIYRSRAGWALLRLPQTRLAEIHEHHHFLWPLPEDYDLGPWLRPQRAAKPTASHCAPTTRSLAPSRATTSFIIAFSARPDSVWRIGLNVAL